MNEQPSPTTLPAPRSSETLPEPAQDFGPESLFMDSKRFEQVCRTAKLMAHQSFCPKHLKGGSEQEGIANCFQVVCQALRWGFDPFAIKDETYVVQNKLGYSGKLVAAVINARARLKRRLDYTFSGDGLDRAVTVIGCFDGEDQPRTATLSVRQAKTGNDMWTKDPDQKLVYSGVIRWARRWCPELVLGVLTDDDLERIQESARSNGPAVGITDLRGYRQATADPLVLESTPPAGAVAQDAQATGSPPAGETTTASRSQAPAGDKGGQPGSGPGGDRVASSPVVAAPNPASSVSPPGGGAASATAPVEQDLLQEMDKQGALPQTAAEQRTRHSSQHLDIIGQWRRLGWNDAQKKAHLKQHNKDAKSLKDLTFDQGAKLLEDLQNCK